MNHPTADGTASASGWIRERIARYANLSLALLCAMLLARVVELTGAVLTIEMPDGFGAVVSRALWSDVLFFLQSFVWLLPPFLLVRMFLGGARADLNVYRAFALLVLAGQAVLVNYFLVARVPLGNDLFGYSYADILTTTRAGYQLTLLSVVCVAVPLVVFWIASGLIGARVMFKSAAAFVLLVISAAVAFGVSAKPDRTAFKSEFAYELALNKGAFFVADSYAHWMPRERSAGIPLSAAGQHSARGERQFQYLDPEYPFLRKDETPDVLGEYFNIEAKSPPNIVFIAVEGLGRAFSGPGAYLGSFTPFLDELSGKSLYWDNFLAAQGRTFASLPSILGSLPYGSKGFNDLGSNMPNHLTLLNILKHNGYQTRFFSGSDLAFDNQGMFLQRQGIDVMVGVDDYDDSYQRDPKTYWGYADREIMQRALATQRGVTQKPFVDYIQTISMHTPYVVPGQHEYVSAFEDRLRQLGLTDAVKDKYRNYRNIYSTVLYTDAALRYYFDEQARLPTYRNTIYIITGDHRLPEIPLATKIDRYHVPLVIYSPMLKRAARIKSISSQLDIAPSLLAFLKRNYGFRVPEAVTWIGSGLDMEPALRNVHRFALKQTINNLTDYVSDMFLLNGDTLFSISDNMGLEPVSNAEKLRELRTEFDLYKAKNDRFQRDLKLYPENLYAEYFRMR